MTNPNIKNIEIRECETIEELQGCVDLQRTVFATPDLENSPVRHLIVTKYAGGFTLGAFDVGKMVGFVLSVPGFKGEKRFFYSHMTAVDRKYQNCGIGAKLKWAQRERSLKEGVNYIKWTFQPVQARNAFFNLERLGANVKIYQPNFYGTDYSTSAEQDSVRGVDSDRLFADWNLDSEKVKRLASGEQFEETGESARKIEIPNDWNDLVVSDTAKAIAEQERIKHEFQMAFADGLIAKGFERSEVNPNYLLYKN
ncbi:MAG: GNAT family N-acetyltransferase [Acidobacteriota bacterium]|nr:GNAT family N-acetyltransferase [Acidobacteriota bacterium]